MAESVIHTRIRQKRDTEANWIANNPVLLDGELIMVKTADNKNKIKIGDGVNNYNQLPFIEDDLAQIIELGWDETDTKTAVGISGKTTIYRCANWTDFPAESPDGQGILISANYGGSGIAGTDSMWVVQFFISARTSVVYKRFINGTGVDSWCEIYSAGNKPYITGEITFANKISDYEYNSSPVPTNHGFMPSKVLYWELPSDDMWNVDQRYLVKSAVRFDTTSFTPQHGYTVEDNSKPPKPITPPQYRYGYIIFK